ncbi:MAG: pseudouridine synthase [Shewanella sp.]
MQIFTYSPPSIPWLDIRYRDRDIIVINKPADLLSNPGRAENTYDCALTRLLHRYPETILVHRLDCATSGIMVFALNKKAESNIKTQFQNRMSTKIYIAEVCGQVDQDQGVIELAMKANKTLPPLQKIAENGKACKTFYKVLERRNSTTLVELKPVTGRTHQLRLHMLALGHPILGDEFYGDPDVIAASNRLRLHAMSLSISHPFSGKKITFKSFHPFQ